MKFLRSPVSLFLLVGLVTIVGIVLGTQHLAAQAAADEAISEARSTTDVLAHSVAEPELPAGIARLRPGALDRFDTVYSNRIERGQVQELIIWKRDGTIAYSSDVSKIQQKFPLDAARLDSLRTGRTGSQIVNAQGDPVASAADAPQGGVVQTFTPIKAPGGAPLLFEAHYSLDQVDARRQEIFTSFRLIALGPLVLLIAIVTLMLSLLTRQITRAGHERERLLHSAIDASDAERRRIARDLHDGVVQDLAGTAYSLSAMARDSETMPETRSTLTAASSSLRDGLKALRSLLAEIHPPDLHPEGLAAALADLTAPATTAHIQASVSVDGAEHANANQTAVLWRVAQEAVRNAIRHSQASTLAVTVRGDASRVALEVVDDGVGFDMEAARDTGQFGLRGLRSLVRDSGGRIEVRSSPGEGTTVHMEVDVR